MFGYLKGILSISFGKSLKDKKDKKIKYSIFSAI